MYRRVEDSSRRAGEGVGPGRIKIADPTLSKRRNKQNKDRAEHSRVGQSRVEYKKSSSMSYKNAQHKVSKSFTVRPARTLHCTALYCTALSCHVYRRSRYGKYVRECTFYCYLILSYHLLLL